jgi:oligopeptidase B
LNAKEEVLLDVDKLAEGKAYYQATGFNTSDDNKLLAYAVDEVSRLQYTIYIKNLVTGETLKDAISNTAGDPCWANDDKTLFYTVKHPVTLLTEKIKRHQLGDDVAADKNVHEEKDNSNYIFVDKSKNNRYIFIYSWSIQSSEISVLRGGVLSIFSGENG